MLHSQVYKTLRLLFLLKRKGMTTIKPINTSQSIYLTLREDVSDVSIVFVKEGQTTEIPVSATVTKQGYYQTATLSIDPALEDGVNYIFTVKSLDNNELHRGSVLCTNQQIENYSINNGSFTTTDTSGNDFILF